VVSRHSFLVHGTPVPQGSLRAFNNRVVANNAGRLERWRGDIRQACGTPQGVTPWRGPVHVVATFLFARPKSHLRADGTPRKGFERRIPRGDIDKLTRALLDALTNVLWDDDEQVVALHCLKEWASFSGCSVIAYEEDRL
jgi:crossover junction endodeoxyribonuclease RusA